MYSFDEKNGTGDQGELSHEHGFATVSGRRMMKSPACLGFAICAASAAMFVGAPLSAQPAQPAQIDQLITGQLAPCDPSDRSFVCGIVNAEDIVRLPNMPWLIASHVNFDRSSSISRPAGLGPLEAVRIDTHEVQRLYPSSESSVDWDRKTYPDCSTPPQEIDSVGLNVRSLTRSKSRLYVANHGGRSSVEIFDVETRGMRVWPVWRGCILAPDYVWPNALAPLPDGGLVVSGFKVGSWRPGYGWERVESYTGTTSNGVEVSRDGKYMVIYSDAGELTRLPIIGSEAPVTLKIPDLDNLRWGDDGYIYATARDMYGPWSSLPKDQQNNRFVSCYVHGICNIPFKIIRVDPDKMTYEELYTSPPNMLGQFGFAATALKIGSDFWLGSVRGDRLAIVPLPHEISPRQR